MTNIEIISLYFSLLENFSTKPSDFEKVLHPDVVQREYPNLMTSKIQERGFAGCLKGAEIGKSILDSQNIEIKDHFENGKKMVVEAQWTGKIAKDIGRLTKGQEIRAHLCMIFEFKDGRVYRQRNYDCYEPF